MGIDKEIIYSLKKKRHNLTTRYCERKNQLAKIDVKEERIIQSQYVAQSKKKKSARKATESDIKDNKKKAESLREKLMVLQSKLEIQQKELRELRGQYLEMEEELIRSKQEYQRCQDYIDIFEVQINSKIVELDIEREELQIAMAKVTEFENTIQMLERDNKALDSSNGVLVIDNTLFHDKIRQMTRQIKQVVHQAERLQQQAT